MTAPDDALDPIIERADDRETWVGIKQGDLESREYDDIRREIAEQIAQAIEAMPLSRVREVRGAYMESTALPGIAVMTEAARIARRFAA